MQTIGKPSSKVLSLISILASLLPLLFLLLFSPKTAWAEEQEICSQEIPAVAVGTAQEIEDSSLSSAAVAVEKMASDGEMLATNIEPMPIQLETASAGLTSESSEENAQEVGSEKSGIENTLGEESAVSASPSSDSFDTGLEEENTDGNEKASDPSVPVTPQELVFDPTGDSNQKEEDSTPDETSLTSAIITYRSGIGGAVRSDTKDDPDKGWTSEVSSFYTSNTRKDVVGAVARATEGFKFDGWVDTTTGVTVSKDTRLIPTFPAGGWPELTTYLAIFSPIEFLLVLDPGEGRGAGFERIQAYGVDVALPDIEGSDGSIVQRRGYEFAGWATANRTDMAITDGGVLSAAVQRSLFAGGAFATTGQLSLTLRALWRELSVTIAYEASTGGTVALLDSNASNRSVNETVGSATGTLTGAIAKAQRGYHFVGWSTADGNTVATNTALSGTAVAAACASEDDGSEPILTDSTFTANFDVNTYKILYTSPKGDSTTSKTDASENVLSYGSSTQVPVSRELFTRDGYSAVGWSTSSDGNGTAFTDGGDITTEDIDRLIEGGILQDEDGASFTLYPIWRADQVAPVNPAVPKTPVIKPEAPKPTVMPLVPAQVSEVIFEIHEKTPEIVEDIVEEITPLQVSAPSSPIVTRSVDSGSMASGIASLMDMSPTEAARVVGNTVTTVAGVGAVAALLSVGASIMGAVAGVGGAATVGVTGVASAGDIAAELAADRNAEGRPGLFARFRQWLKKMRDQFLKAQEVLG